MQIFKSKMFQLILCGIVFHGKRLIAGTGAVSHRDVVGVRERNVLAILQVIELRPRLDVQKSCHMTRDILHRDIFVVLWGIRAHFQPQQVAGVVDMQPANHHIAVMYGVRAAGQTAMAKSITTVLHEDAFVHAVFGQSVCPWSASALQHNGIIVDFQIAVLDQYIRADIQVNRIGAGGRDRLGRGVDAAIQIPDAAAAVEMSRPEMGILQRDAGKQYVAAMGQIHQPRTLLVLVGALRVPTPP